MNSMSSVPSDRSRWRSATVLKSDHFSTVERGFWREDNGEVEGVLRRFDHVPWWIRPVAYHFGRREARALERLGGVAGRRFVTTHEHT